LRKGIKSFSALQDRLAQSVEGGHRPSVQVPAAPLLADSAACAFREFG
jgi:hypothetical protein